MVNRAVALENPSSIARDTGLQEQYDATYGLYDALLPEGVEGCNLRYGEYWAVPRNGGTLLCSRCTGMLQHSRKVLYVHTWL
jgi:hypothetical protein